MATQWYIDVRFEEGSAILVTTDDGTFFRCSVEWVPQDHEGGAGQCLAERWVLRSTAQTYVGPPAEAATSPDELARVVNDWWSSRLARR